MAATIETERLQKYLSALGVGSRRQIEQWISRGKISVDGKIAAVGDRVSSSSRIDIDGRPLKFRPPGARRKQRRRLLLYNKPKGEICTRSDPKNRPTVFSNLPSVKGQRWVAVGRLDINTSGLMLFTNDGDLANRLMHPGSGLEREYLCRVFGEVSAADIEKLKSGIELDGDIIRFHRVTGRKGENMNTWYSVTVTEGRYREVRRMWEAVGCRVSRLNRIRYGKVALPRGLKPGGWIELNADAITRLSRNRDGDEIYVPKVGRKGKF